jgi:DNA-binding beta-propeller fold protein YncE
MLSSCDRYYKGSDCFETHGSYPFSLLLTHADACGIYLGGESLGSYGTKNGQFSEPQGIATDSKGNVYVADTLNHRVQVFDSNGKYKSSFGKFGEKSGEFRFPHDIVVDSKGNIYVADSQNGRVQKFNDKYKFVKAWGTREPAKDSSMARCSWR